MFYVCGLAVRITQTVTSLSEQKNRKMSVGTKQSKCVDPRRAAVTVNGLLNEPHFNNSNSETGLQKMSRVSFTRKTRETKETDDVSNIRLLKVRQRNLTFLKVCLQKRLMKFFQN